MLLIIVRGFIAPYCYDGGPTAEARTVIEKAYTERPDNIVVRYTMFGLWTCPLVFCSLKSLPKNALVLQQQILFAFFLHALSACMLLHDCRSRVASLATSDQAVRRDASRFRFPARPTPVCTSFRLSCGASLPDCHRQSFHLHGIPGRLTFAGLHWLSCSTSRWCGLPPSCYTSPALLHLAVRCTPCQKRM